MLSSIAALVLAVAAPARSALQVATPPRPVLAVAALARSMLDVPLPPGELRGQVLGAKGQPVPSFTVNGVAFADPHGQFKILTPPEGEFRVVVRADGFAPNVFHVQGASGKKLVIPEIRLGEGEHVLGEVVDAETGVPVRDAHASLADPAKLERLRFVRPERVAGLGVTGSGGFFELKRAPRGLLILVVQHPDYLPEFVPVNTRDRLPDVKLHRGGTITGVVRDAKGAPMPGARVVALSEDATDGAEANADIRGHFELKRLRPGHYRVVATSLGQAVEAPFQVPLGDGMVADVAIELKTRLRQLQLQEIELGGELPATAPEGALASR